MTYTGLCELCNDNPCTCMEKFCEHEVKTYQPKEWDTNIPETYTCDECDKEFDIPEPDWDLLRKE